MFILAACTQELKRHFCYFTHINKAFYSEILIGLFFKKVMREEKSVFLHALKNIASECWESSAACLGH